MIEFYLICTYTAHGDSKLRLVKTKGAFNRLSKQFSLGEVTHPFDKENDKITLQSQTSLSKIEVGKKNCQVAVVSGSIVCLYEPHNKIVKTISKEAITTNHCSVSFAGKVLTFRENSTSVSIVDVKTEEVTAVSLSHEMKAVFGGGQYSNYGRNVRIAFDHLFHLSKKPSLICHFIGQLKEVNFTPENWRKNEILLDEPAEDFELKDDHLATVTPNGEVKLFQIRFSRKEITAFDKISETKIEGSTRFTAIAFSRKNIVVSEYTSNPYDIKLHLLDQKNLIKRDTVSMLPTGETLPEEGSRTLSGTHQMRVVILNHIEYVLTMGVFVELQVSAIFNNKLYIIVRHYQASTSEYFNSMEIINKTVYIGGQNCFKEIRIKC